MGAKIKQKIQCAFVSAFSKTSVKVEEIKVVGEDKNWDENEDERWNAVIVNKVN